MIKTSITFGKKILNFELQYGSRKTLSISVHPDLKIMVKAPKGRELKEIKRRVKKRAPWILKQLSYFQNYLPPTPPRKYISGETHYYRGRQYLLKILKREDAQVKLKGGYICIHTPDKKDTSLIKEQLDEWYNNHAQRVLAERLEKGINLLKRHGITFDEKPGLQIRRMKKRWGSCTEKGKVILNLELIKASTFCMDYVVIHELCHLKIPNHSKGFYSLLERGMPDWKVRKERLERMLV